MQSTAISSTVLLYFGLADLLCSASGLNSLINDYNIHVKDRVVNFLEGFSYVVSPIAAELSKVLVEGNPVAATEAGLLALGRITRKGEGVDKQEVITAEYAPAAMFHDISRILGWPIDRK